MATVQVLCFLQNTSTSSLCSLRRITNYPVPSTAWTSKTDLAVLRPIMVMLIAGGFILPVLTTYILARRYRRGVSTPSAGGYQFACSRPALAHPSLSS